METKTLGWMIGTIVFTIITNIAFLVTLYAQNIYALSCMCFSGFLATWYLVALLKFGKKEV